MNRYLHQTEGTIFDCEKNQCFLFPEDTEEFTNLLNQQDARIKELEKENQQLKEQLSNEEQSHSLCIKSFEEETEKLRKQIKFESDARERFKQYVDDYRQYAVDWIYIANVLKEKKEK